MQKLVFFLYFLCFVCFLSDSYASDSETPGVTLDLIEGEEPEETPILMKHNVNTILEIGNFFNESYPDDQINEDLSGDLRVFFPNVSPQIIYSREAWVREGVKFYRWVTNIIKEIKETLLLPEPPPMIYKDEDYDTGYHEAYIPSDDKHAVVVEDFKKVLAYGSDPKDFQALRAKINRDKEKEEPKTHLEALGKMLSKIDIKKIFKYGIYYDDPISGTSGQGKWIKSNGLGVRIISESGFINSNNTIKTALEFMTPPLSSVLAIDKPPYQAISIDLSESENIKDYHIFSPVPTRNKSAKGEYIIGYTESFSIPITIDVKDIEKPVKLKAKISLNLCNIDECLPFSFEPELKIEPGKGYASSSDNFIILSYNNLPQSSLNELKLESLVVDKDNDGKQTLRLTFQSSKEVQYFDAFLDKNAEFFPPRTTINDGTITLRFTPRNNEISLEGKTFIVYAKLNKYYFLKTSGVAESASLLDIIQKNLSLGIILISILGGLILNLMPCVFPVLSIKVLSLAKQQGKALNTIRKSFLFNALGIYISFFCLALFLSLLKHLGYSVGWGMQFQNAVFLCVIIFIIALFMCCIGGMVNIPKPGMKSEGNLSDVSLGFLTTLMATPCTAPYLGTAISFALAGNTFNIYVIMLSVGFGLSLPYLLFALIPHMAAYAPKPGTWMMHLEKIMNFMLFLTLLWLLFILMAQTSAAVAMRLSLYLAVFFVVIWFKKIFIEEIPSLELEDEVKDIMRKGTNVIGVFILLIIFGIALFDVSKNFSYHRAETLSKRESAIDFKRIGKYVEDGKPVFVSVNANWCLSCGYNELVVLNSPSVRRIIENKNIQMIDADWTNYNAEILDFMSEFGRKGLPFYIIFSPKFPDGFVLPEILNETELIDIFENMI